MDTISLQRLKTIEEYLDINGQPAPYYVHDEYKKVNLFPKRAVIGKGSPQEIKKALQEGLDESNTIGIDCSGFICHVIASTQKITSVIRHPSLNLFTRFRFFIRPIEKTSVGILIHPVNAVIVSQVSEIQPWDLIHIGDIHIMIIYNVENGVIYYTHASETEKMAVKSKIEIIDSTNSLENQKWLDTSTQQYYHVRPQT